MSRISSEEKLTPGLYFVATPLGNARDITLRTLDILGQADVLAAEDTRRLRQLMDIHGIALNGRRIVAYHDHNGPSQRPGLLAALAEGKSVAYASDAGTPLVADPGFVLGREAIAAGASVFSAPGPVAAIAALTVAGLPSDVFTFAGFPPSAKGPRAKFFKEFATAPGTLILYESPKRVADTLAIAVNEMGGDRPAVLARELTKKFEDVRRGTLDQLVAQCAAEPPRGEIVLLIGAGEQKFTQDQIDDALGAAMQDMKLKDAARLVADQFNLSRRDLYQRGLELQQD